MVPLIYKRPAWRFTLCSHYSRIWPTTLLLVLLEFFRWLCSSLVAPSWKVLGRAPSSMVNSGVLSSNKAISTTWAAWRQCGTSCRLGWREQELRQSRWFPWFQKYFDLKVISPEWIRGSALIFLWCNYVLLTIFHTIRFSKTTKDQSSNKVNIQKKVKIILNPWKPTLRLHSAPHGRITLRYVTCIKPVERNCLKWVFKAAFSGKLKKIKRFKDTVAISVLQHASEYRSNLKGLHKVFLLVLKRIYNVTKRFDSSVFIVFW